MQVSEFKRAMFKTLNPKVTKAAIKEATKSRKGALLTYSAMACRAAVGSFEQDFRGFLLGFALNQQMRDNGIESIGHVLQHAVNVAKLVKGKIPGAGKIVRSKNTFAYLLTEIDRTSADLFQAVYFPLSKAAVIKMTPAEQQVAEQKYAARAAKSPMLKLDKSKHPAFNKVQTEPVDEEKVKVAVTALLKACYEFVQAMYQQTPAVVMDKHLTHLKPLFPAGFFDAPPQKKAPSAGKAAEQASV